MTRFNFNNKTFLLVDNSEAGTVNTETVFKYQQNENVITGEYAGGAIVCGNIIGTLKGENLQMVYQCLTKEGELKSGRANADVSLDNQGKIRLKLDWQWLTATGEKGTSEYVEQ
ncbi:hypothetical protein [Flagellimonas myxillae]|uniref:hypothetical protein n=1 Tax=Flagellimonas myxillae TaxID=2942214 RepID=UPI00201E9198|nr:hypothetical protein [Muricauda myxillae]MCL6267418.1 hypothetical protein [Muricauda myxillae]